MAVHVFVGPTLPAQEVLAAVPRAEVHPPVAHGDLLRLGLRAGDVAVVIDGNYHQTGAVRHKEILAVLAAGAGVIGCASMGALRAAELHPFGMVGHGVVYDMFRAGTIDADDEVAVAHSEPPEYVRLSEPLVNIRYAIDAALAAGALNAEQADALLRAARGLHYTERSWKAVEHACGTAEGAAVLRRFLDEQPNSRDIKAQDAAGTLRRLDLLMSSGEAWAASPGWRNRFLYDWEARFAGTLIDGIHVEHAAVARYQQIYHPDFPERWRSFALGRISGQGEGGGLQAALAAAEAAGVTATALGRARLRHWLTTDEIATLPVAEQVTRVLTRSYRPPRMAADMVAAAGELMDDPDAKRVVARSYEVNAKVASERPGQGVQRLKVPLLRAHLADAWRLEADDQERLLAGARDRGFDSVAAAVGVLRPYFLRNHLLAAGQVSR